MLGKLASQLESNDFWQNHCCALTEHDGFCFDTSDAPANNSETVDHGCVGVSSDNAVRIQEAIFVEDDSGQILEVYLMNDTESWRDDAEVLES